MDKAPTVVVIGASVGGVEAVRSIAAALPAGLAAAVFVVLHIGAHRSELPWLLNQAGALPACHPADGDPIRPGHIYVAPPDHHMLVERGRVRLTRGPRENWARPAVDPLFRSAARSYGPGAIGVILTGGLNDGTAGLYEIGQCGGTTVVQDPDEAADPGMPRSALRHVAVHHCLPLREIPALLVALVGERPGLSGEGAREAGPDAGPAPETGLEAGTGAAGEGGAERVSDAMTAEYKLDDPVAVTCPDCGGALSRTELGTLTQFRCHIGHVYTAEVMVAAQFAALEWSLGAAMRALSERGELCRQMAHKAASAGDDAGAARWDGAMHEAKARTEVLRTLLGREWTHPADTGPAEPSGA